MHVFFFCRGSSKKNNSTHIRYFIVSIQKKIILFFTILSVILLLLLLTLWQMWSYSNLLTELEERRYESYSLAEELRRSSDDLTRMARTYTVTGDARFKRYFDYIAGIRDGLKPRPKEYNYIFWDFVTAQHQLPEAEGEKVSIVALMKKLQFSERELALLEEAKRLSDDLIHLEVRAFNAMEGKFLQPDGKYRKTGPPDQKLAMNLVHGSQYHKAKAEIMGKIDDFFHLLELRTLHEVESKKEKQTLLVYISIVLSVLLMVISLSSYHLFKTSITSPLSDLLAWVKDMQNGKYDFNTAMSQNDEIGTLARAFVFMAKKVAEHIKGLEQLSKTDALTQIHNRIYLDDALVREKYKFDRYHTDSSLIMIDIDFFKKINDQHGHLIGDKVLIQVSRLLVNNTRKSDIVGRWGGEEFLVICPNTGLAEGKTLAESLRKKIEAQSFELINRVTISCGVSAFEKEGSIETFINTADEKMYAAKSQGRNRVC